MTDEVLTGEEVAELFREGEAFANPTRPQNKYQYIPLGVTISLAADGFGRFEAKRGYAAYTSIGVFATGRWVHADADEEQRDILFPYDQIAYIEFNAEDVRQLVQEATGEGPSD